MTTAMHVADSRRLCYARSVHRSTLRSTLRGTAGLGLVEVLAVTVIVGIAVIGVALMFGKGSAWVSATGADRVAAGLAQQRIEQIRACGWEVATAKPSESQDCPGLPGPPGEPPPPALMTALGVLLREDNIRAGNNHMFTRDVCIQYVDPTTPQGLDERPFTLAGGCPPGDPTFMVRITVVVSSSERSDLGLGRQPETTPVTLQAWMSR
jgi:hypothetical protein